MTPRSVRQVTRDPRPLRRMAGSAFLRLPFVCWRGFSRRPSEIFKHLDRRQDDSNGVAYISYISDSCNVGETITNVNVATDLPSCSFKVWAPGGDAVSVAGVMNMYVYSRLFPPLRQREGRIYGQARVNLLQWVEEGHSLI